jgi:chromosome segregation ATPase
LDDDLSEYDNKKIELTSQLESHQEDQKELNEELEECAKNAEIYCTKIATIQAKREDCSRKVELLLRGHNFFK